MSACLLAAGCAHEYLPRPPPPADIARVNEAAADNDWFRVEYVEPLPPGTDLPVERPIGIASADDRQISLVTRAGDVKTLPAQLVRGVTVKERAPGALYGGLAGLGWGALAIGGLYLLANLGPEEPGVPASPCDAGCKAKVFVPLMVVPTIIGAIVGYFVGGRRTFELVPPTPLPTPL
ncbi:MAG TPA: hypothetical protein VIF57_01755 [Polyangia bacterium]|jgi:hypothetical protein